MTQKERVLKMLRDAGPKGIRSDRFLAEDVRIPRAAARVGELIAQGHDITSEREKQYTRYTLIAAAPRTFVGVSSGQVPSQDTGGADSEYPPLSYKATADSGESLELFPKTFYERLQDAA